MPTELSVAVMAHISKLFSDGEAKATITDFDKVLEWIKLSPGTFKQVTTKVGTRT